MVRLLVIAAISVLCAAGAAQELQSLAAATTARNATPTAASVATPVPAPPAISANAQSSSTEANEPGEAQLAKSADGHFWADAQVDGHPVRFLVDTGATAVALTGDDARNLGIDPDSLVYGYTVMTANGPARAAEVKLNVVTVGDAQVSDVQAFVIDKGLPASLLGMTYLGRLAKFEATQDSMVLKS